MVMTKTTMTTDLLQMTAADSVILPARLIFHYHLQYTHSLLIRIVRRVHQCLGRE